MPRIVYTDADRDYPKGHCGGMEEKLYFVNWHVRGEGVVDGARLEERRGLSLKDVRGRIARERKIKAEDVIIYDSWILRRGAKPGARGRKIRA